MTIGDVLKEKGVTVVSTPNNKKSAGKTPAANIKTCGFTPPVVPTTEGIPLTPEERQAVVDKFTAFKTAVKESMDRAVAQIRAFWAMPAQERPAFEREAATVWSCIQEMLDYADTAARRVAVAAFAAVWVATCPRNRGALASCVEQLVKVGFLVVGSGRNAVRIYDHEYRLANEYSRDVESQGVLKSLEGLLKETIEAGRERVLAEIAELEQSVGENPLAPADLRAVDPADNGRRCHIVVADVHMPDGHVFKGGHLLIQVKGRQIHPVRGAGFITRLVDEAAELGAYILPEQIGGSRLDPRGRRLDREEFNATLNLWRWVSAAVTAAEHKAEAAMARTKAAEAAVAECETMLASTGMTADQLIGDQQWFLEGAVGTTLVSWATFGKGSSFSWQHEKDGQKVVTEVANPSALVERRVDGQIRVSACPERLKPFWGGTLEFQAPGERFVDLGLLGVFLRIGYAKAFADRKRAVDAATPVSESNSAAA